jgi:hypothetical protein
VQPLAELPPGWPRPTIDLGGLTVAALADNDGRNWFGEAEVLSQKPKLGLQLVGFTYERIQQDPERDRARQTVVDFNDTADDTEKTGAVGALLRVRRRVAGLTASALRLFRPRRVPIGSVSRSASEKPAVHRIHARMTWLKSQYATYPPLRDYYQPEPYVQLARTMRAAGNMRDANNVMYEKNLLRARLRPDPGWRALTRLLYRLSRYPYVALIATVGSAVVKPIRMLAIFFVVWGLGMGILLAFPQALRVETSAVGTVLTTKGGVVVQKNHVPTNQQATEIVCGNHISKFVYPLDVMIPFLDLRQESRCDFGSNEQGWAIAKGLYALLGWIVTAGVILSASSLVRRQFDF